MVKLVMILLPILISLFVLSFFFPISPPLSQPVLDEAVTSLYKSGYKRMSLYLEHESKTLITKSSSSLTIFAFPDLEYTFTNKIRFQNNYHYSPLKYSIKILESLPFGTKIPTFVKNVSLIVTSSASEKEICLNNVKVYEFPIYETESLIVLRIEKIFDPCFDISEFLSPKVKPSFVLGYVKEFSNDYSVMASFLDLQLLPIEDQFTVFAPKDVEMKLHLKNFSNHNSIFRRHVVGYKLSLKDLVNLAGDIALPTFSDGFEINVTCSGDILVLNNGIHVVDPDMYTTDRIVVHGIAKMLGLKEEEVRSMVSSEKF